MTNYNGEDIVLVSDLHLGPGSLDCVESFYHDKAFARFLDELCRRARDERRSWRLVILGDFIDFLRMELVTDGCEDGPPEATATAILDRVAQNHPTVFEALARFLSAGFPIDVVLGNHDAELIRPGLQERLREILATAGAGANAGDVSFHPWLFHVPGLLYAEHGHQHDGVHSFATILDPYDEGDPERVQRTVGSFLFCGHERLLCGIDPCADHASSPLQYFRLAARRRPAALADVTRQQLDLVRRVMAHARQMSGPGWTARRVAYRETTLRSYATEVKLGYDTVLALDDMSSASQQPSSILVKQALKKTNPGRRAVEVAIGGYLAATRARTPAMAAAGVAAGTLALSRSGRTTPPTGGRSTYLQKASARINRLLDSEGSGVPYYVFGHTHGALHVPLDFGPRAPQYINTGTWSSVVARSSEPLRTLLPTFVQISRERPDSAPVARLLAWNESTAAAETLRFQT